MSDLEIMYNKQNYSNLQTVLEIELKRICEQLYLPDIRLCVDLNAVGSLYNPDCNLITVGLKDIKNHFDTTVIPYLNHYLQSINDIILWSLYHEVGHYLQHYKYSRWYDKYLKEHYDFRNFAIHCSLFITKCKRYRKLKMEKNADKIAFILLRQREKKVSNFPNI